MEDENEDKNINGGVKSHEYRFNYNFINIPWDYRTKQSKIAIIALLLAIFVATMACVSHNIITHYNNLDTSPQKDFYREVKCNLVKIDGYPFAARIHSAKTNELLCVGAVISTTSVLANAVCVKAGPVQLRLGSLSDPHCKKIFPVDAIEPIVDQGSILKQLVLLTTYENIAYCGRIISIGRKLIMKAPAYIIGRPLRSGRSLSRQPAKLLNVDTTVKKHASLENSICVTGVEKCPIRVGDLLIQGDYVYGLALTTTQLTEHNKVACFADLRSLQHVGKPEA